MTPRGHRMAPKLTPWVANGSQKCSQSDQSGPQSALHHEDPYDGIIRATKSDPFLCSFSAKSEHFVLYFQSAFHDIFDHCSLDRSLC